jgi:ABC-type sugar transport system substrate-binding protein
MTSFTDMDYIVCIGDPAAIGIVCALAAQMNGGRFTVLKWDRQEHVYYPVHVDLNVD